MLRLSLQCGGMNGYLSLCNGDPCPPVFRSPVKGMEDIMDNQVICVIYILPDEHKHITRPPVGVILPEKTVTSGDLKPPPVLWHEDTGRWPMENGRQAPPGAISGRQLGDAAHRLVRNSLQSRTEPGHSPPSPCGMVPNGIPYSNGRHHHGNQWQAPSGVHANNGYLQVSTASHQHEQSSSVHSHFVTIQFNRSYNNNNLHYHRRDSRIDPRRVSPPVHVNNGYGYLPPPVPQIPVAGPYVQNLPRAYGGYQSYGSQQRQPRNDNSRVVYGDNSRRAYGNNSLQTNNRFSALSRGGSNCGPPPPPRPGYGRC